MTPSEREQRIEAGMRATYPVVDRVHVETILDAADEAVPNVAEPGCAYVVTPGMKRLADEHAALEERVEKAEAAARDLIMTGEWVIQCLRDVIARKPVRGLDEALSGWEHVVASFSEEEGTEE